MPKNKLLPIIRFWMSPKLPLEHVFIDPTKRPKGFKNIFRVYFRKWMVHPIKRRIAKYYLVILKTFFGLKVIGITGSAGKTTTKEMIASILSQSGETVASFANIDPVYNIPTTILKAKPSTKYLVLEMGVEFKGEMDFYLWLARPNVGVLTNIYPTHTLFFGNTDGVFKEKSKLVKALDKKDSAVFSSEGRYSQKLIKKVSAKYYLFGKGGDFFAENVKINSDFSTSFILSFLNEALKVKIPVIGSQFVQNALAASAASFALGVKKESIVKGLSKFKKPEHRMNVIKLKSGAFVVDDSYNNNPEAARLALETFSGVFRKEKKIIVFGDMLELGKDEILYHKKWGRMMADLGLEKLIGVGNLSKYLVSSYNKSAKKKGIWVESADEVFDSLLPYFSKNHAILVKGSRSIGLEKVISKL